MKNKKITRNISQGVYVLTTDGGGCIVDAVNQISSGDNPYIAVAVMKTNNTNLLMKQNKTFALSVLSPKVDGNIIETFGYHSSKNYDKFSKVDCLEEHNLKIIKNSIGYLICEIIDHVETPTHTLFIGKLIEADKFNDDEEMTFNYFQNHKEEYIKVKTKEGKTAWVCTVCGYVYYGEELPKDFKCPVCGVGPEFFKKTEK